LALRLEDDLYVASVEEMPLVEELPESFNVTIGGIPDEPLRDYAVGYGQIPPPPPPTQRCGEPVKKGG
jgi:hypothetical protein